MGRSFLTVRDRVLGFIRGVGRPVSAGEILSYGVSGRYPAAVVRETLDSLEAEGLVSFEVVPCPSRGPNAVSRIYRLMPRPSLRLAPGSSRARPPGPRPS